MGKSKINENLQIVKKSMEGADKKYLLKLNRAGHCLEVFAKVSNDILREYYSIREDFDTSAYVMYEKIKSFYCICGGYESPTPYGMFNIEKISKDCYVSGYHKRFDQVKFFGYMVIFEDYFIHSNMYLMNVDEDMMRSGYADCISIDDEFTSGCIRVKQDDLDWMLDVIEVGSLVLLQ